MKNIIIILAIIATIATIASCTKLSENMRIEQIKRPIINVDSIIVNPWDTIPPPPTPPDIGH